jgi:hypothetical protein
MLLRQQMWTTHVESMLLRQQRAEADVDYSRREYATETAEADVESQVESDSGYRWGVLRYEVCYQNSRDRCGVFSWVVFY